MGAINTTNNNAGATPSGDAGRSENNTSPHGALNAETFQAAMKAYNLTASKLDEMIKSGVDFSDPASMVQFQRDFSLSEQQIQFLSNVVAKQLKTVEAILGNIR